MKKDITKRCRACELNFDRLNKKKDRKDYKIPDNIPVSENMRKSVNILRGYK